MYDHFHCVYSLDGETHEIEGGLVPSDSEEWTSDVRKRTWNEALPWLTKQAVAWGMPENAEIVGFRVAG